MTPRNYRDEKGLSPSNAGAIDRRLKVLLVHERFPPDFAGGGEYIVLEVARHLQAIGHTVTVVTTGDPAITKHEGIPTVRLPISPYRMNLAWRRVRDLARDADLIHAFTYHALIPSMCAGRLLRKPVVCGVLALFGNAWLEMRGRVAGRLWRGIERYLLKLPFDVKLHLSDFALALSRETGVYRTGDRVLVPGISYAQFYASEQKPYVLFASKLDVRKGIGMVLEVARRLPDVPFRIVGWGNDFDAVAAAAPSNARVEARPVKRENYLETMAGARIFLFPTMVETFGLVLPEAMAAGCAVVSTSPLPFEGARIAQGDVDGATAAVRALWDDAAACARYGAINREIARCYDWHTHALELGQVYRQVMDARGAT